MSTSPFLGSFRLTPDPVNSGPGPYAGVVAAAAKLDREQEKAAETSSVFYILWCPSSSLPPTKRFRTEWEALDVARKMSETKNITLYVLRAVAEIAPVRTVTTRII